MTCEENSGEVFADLVRIVNQSTTNRTLFHLRTVDEIRASFANRDEGTDRNAWLYS
jgi:salicylate hydroxylase